MTNQGCPLETSHCSHALIFLASLFLLLLSACSVAPVHNALPEEVADQVTVSGFSKDIRFWADELPANSETLVMKRLEDYRQANQDYYTKFHTYPPLHYLAISGGAYDGAFGAGFLYGWSKTGARPDFEIVTGVSTGALIAPLVFIGPQYDEIVKKLFTSTNSDAIFMTSVWNVLDGVTGGLAISDSTPLANKIEEVITPHIMAEIAREHQKGKRLFIGTTNIEAQRGMIWDIGAIATSGNPKALSLIHQVLLASASIPGAFLPVFIDVEAGGKHYSEIHVDGGVTSQVFIYPLKLRRSVIDQFAMSHLERYLYIIRNSKIEPEYKILQPGFFGLTRRSLETLTKYHGLGDLYRIYLGSQRDGIDYNLTYIPASFKAESTELFDPVYMKKLFKVGYKLSQKPDIWIKKPPGLDYLPETDTP